MRIPGFEDLFTCGGGPQKGNSMCFVFRNKADDALKYPWVGASFDGNLEYTAEYTTKILQKAISDWKSEPWYSLLDQLLDQCGYKYVKGRAGSRLEIPRS